jgi:hypothetical protein
MIASPGDVTQYRTQARDVLHEWNYIHSSSTSVVLMPVGWETHSSPELGVTAQELINERILEDCDLLVGIFWTRLGSPTGRAQSGTVEEIQRHVEGGKPAMIYFCEAPVALQTVDHAQYAALQEFRAWCSTQGLIEPFLNPAEFQAKLRRHLQIALQKNDYLRNAFLQASLPGDSRRANNGDQPLVDELSAIAATLSPEASQLLLAAADDKDGVIIAIDVLAGRIIQAGEKQFGEMDDRRSMAKLDYGLQQLLTLGLIEMTGAEGKGSKLYQLVERGYQLADRLHRREQ